MRLRCLMSTIFMATLNITATVNCLETDLLNLKINVGIDII